MIDRVNDDELTGGKKYDKSKESFDLIPMMPLLALAELFTLGKEKYGVRNWEKGMKFGRLFAAMMRHAIKWWAGEKYDLVDGQHHLAAVMWNAMVLMEFENTHPEMDDREPQNYPLRANVGKGENIMKKKVDTIKIPKDQPRLSALRAIVQKVFEAKTLDAAQELIRKCLESSKVNDTDKQTMLDEIMRIKKLERLHRYIVNAILAYEGDRVV